jgi:hypothetical protein
LTSAALRSCGRAPDGRHQSPSTALDSPRLLDDAPESPS